MIRLDMPQGSAEWFQARLGVATASAFDKIMTPKTMKLSGSAEGYGHRLIAEQWLGMPLEQDSSGFMARGADMEQAARDWYAIERDVEPEPVGFVLRDDRRVGCSPDAFVGTNGLLEIKVPSAHVHIGYLLDEAGIDYRCQVQGQLWVAEREWCDTVSYHPTLPKSLVRVVRDEEFITALARVVGQFLEYVDELKATLARRGYDVPIVYHPLTLMAERKTA